MRNSSRGRKRTASRRSGSSNSKLVKDWAVAVGYEGDYPYALDMWTADAWLPVRDEIEEKGLVDEKVKEIDRFAVEFVLKNAPDFLPGIPSEKKPLEKWWWHFYEIAINEYPVELLPDYLREVVSKK